MFSNWECRKTILFKFARIFFMNWKLYWSLIKLIILCSYQVVYLVPTSFPCCISCPTNCVGTTNHFSQVKMSWHSCTSIFHRHFPCLSFLHYIWYLSWERFPSMIRMKLAGEEIQEKLKLSGQLKFPFLRATTVR